MAWIVCRCAVCPNGCNKQKEIGPPRTAGSSPGLCDWCKSQHHQMRREPGYRPPDINFVSPIVRVQLHPRSRNKRSLIVGLARVSQR